MNLLIISNMAHYLDANRRILGWGPTVEEINHLSRLFDQVRHIGCLHQGNLPAAMLPYSARNMRLIPLFPTGGETLAKKLGIVMASRSYVQTILRELPWADAVHVRCPANIPMMAIILLALTKRPRYRWVKYAGNWHPEGSDPWSYTLQRWWLNKGLHRGVVTVNGKWHDQPKHVYSFLNPSLTQEEMECARQIAVRKELSLPLELLFVGRIETPKGAGRALQIAALLEASGIAFHLHLVGDGPERPQFEQWAKEHGIEKSITFYGWIPKPALGEFYARSHILLFPTAASEGWPKVMSEAMAYGCVPVAGAVSSIPQILAETQTGFALPPQDLDSFARVILNYVRHPDDWERSSQTGAMAAYRFTYKYYLESVQKMFQAAWGIHLNGKSA